MEINWRQSQLYRKRQSELDEAIAQCQRFQINPKIDGFIARHAYQGRIPFRERPAHQLSSEAQAALERYNSALAAMASVREEFIMNLGREQVAHQMIAEGWDKGRVYTWLQSNHVLLHAARQFVGVWNGIAEAPFQLSIAEVDALGLEG